MSGVFCSFLINQGVSWWIYKTLGIGGVVSLVFCGMNLQTSSSHSGLLIKHMAGVFFATLAESSYSLDARCTWKRCYHHEGCYPWMGYSGYILDWDGLFSDNIAVTSNKTCLQFNVSAITWCGRFFRYWWRL